MKKFIFIGLLLVLTTTILFAGNTVKFVRLQVINDSNKVVMIKLEGKTTNSFYYLTIPARESRNFTIAVDVYKRTTWACGGVMDTGELVMTSQVRLRFVACHVLLSCQSDECWRLLESKKINRGEPTMEKITYYKFDGGAAAYESGIWIYLTGLWKVPVLGCHWRYRY